MLLIFEREALMQRFLQFLAFRLSDSKSAQEVHKCFYLFFELYFQLLYGRIPQRIDSLLNAEELHDERGLILCMHLYNELRSTETFMRMLSTYPEDKLTCLNKYKRQLKVQ